MAKDILTDDQLMNITGGFTAGDGEDISANFRSCKDWVCETCRKPCREKCHICDNGSISRTVCCFCSHYDKVGKICLLGKTEL